MTATTTNVHSTSYTFEEVGAFSAFVKAFTQQHKHLEPFVNGFFTKEGLDAHLEAKLKNYTHRTSLVSALKVQLAAVQLSTAQQESISHLEKNNTITITTGHQLSLFNGPMYFIYKILQVAKTCKELSELYPTYNFVPIFWMASEDHDYDEVRKAQVFGKEIALQEVENNYQMVGSFSANVLNDAVSELSSYLETAPYGEPLISELKSIQKESKNLTDFTQKLVASWFADFGVLPLDGNDTALKKCFAPIVEKELKEQISYKATKAVLEDREKLFKTQVEPREINLFFIDGKQRRRIVKAGDTFTLLGTDRSFTEAELLKLNNENPELFSPNVILRPVYQELILPNLAYCGGGGEIAYWTQLKGVFDVLNLCFPKLILRNSLVLLDAGVNKKKEKLGLSDLDLFKDVFSLQNNYLAKHSDVESLDLTVVNSDLETLRTSLINYVNTIDPTLKGTVEGNMAAQHKFLDSLQKKLKKKLKQQEEVALKQIEGVKEKIYPNGVFQERIEHPYRYLSKYGKPFFKTIYNTIDPFKALVHLVHIE